MATIAETRRSAASGEERFFLTMALAMAGLLVAGFSLNAAMGRSSFSAPLLYHVHGLAFFGWVALYVTQNALVATGNVAIHRRLGWLSLLYVPVLVVLGTAMTIYSIRATGGPPFFAINEFLVAAPFSLFTFAGFVFAAVALRRRTDWHRRLMFAGMASLLGPGIGRLLPMPLFIPWAWWIGSVLPPLIFMGFGMIADKRRLGHVHPAWVRAALIFVGAQVAADLIAFSPLGEGFTRMVVEGTPGAARTMAAFFPS